MTAADIIAIAVIALTIGGAIFYIVRSKKKGQKCIGCPHSSSCSSSCCSSSGKCACSSKPNDFIDKTK